tara:strand:- start:919 stop:1542 length:624 start_codon:yes stop_codon:yes gene_type:complete
MLLLGIIILSSYIIGSINAGIIISKLQGLDIRAKGSGNAGATNVLRVIGIKFGFLVFIIDCLKGFLALYLTQLLISNTSEPLALNINLYLYFSSFASLLGHCYPVWFSFKGGKGAATGLGNILYIDPFLISVPLIVFIGILFFFRYVGLSTIMAFFSLFIFSFFSIEASNFLFLIYLFFLFLFIVFTHRTNITSMLEKTEHKISFFQ